MLPTETQPPKMRVPKLKQSSNTDRPQAYSETPTTDQLAHLVTEMQEIAKPPNQPHWLSMRMPTLTLGLGTDESQENSETPATDQLTHLAPEMQRIMLCGRLLEEVLERALQTPEGSDSTELVGALEWVRKIPYNRNESIPFEAMLEQPKEAVEWIELFRWLTERLHVELRLIGLGEVRLQNIFSESCRHLIERHSFLPTLWIITAILPEALVDTGLLRQLNKAQLARLFLSTRTHLNRTVSKLVNRQRQLRKSQLETVRMRLRIREAESLGVVPLDSTQMKGVLIVSGAGLVTSVNKKVCEIWAGERNRLLGAPITDLLPDLRPPLQARTVESQLVETLAPFMLRNLRLTARRLNGSTVELTVKFAQTGKGTELRVTVLETTHQSDRGEQNERLSLALQGANDGVWDWDLKHDRFFFSNHFKTMLGYQDEDIGSTSTDWLKLFHPDEVDIVSQKIEAHLAGLKPRLEFEYRMRRKDGTYRWILTRGIAVRDETGQPIRMTGLQTDLTKRKQIDPLTHLPSREQFLTQLENVIERTKGDDSRAAVLFIDLDRFKVVNDSEGHLVGDELLMVISNRLKACIRPGDMVARLGGDEFAVLLDRIADLDDVLGIANRIQQELTTPVYLKHTSLFTTASIGIALSVGTDERPEDLLGAADRAMYRAKALGKARIEIFDAEMRNDNTGLLQLETDLHHAINREEFIVYYQPIVTFESSQPYGFEALVRWRHPQRGIVNPKEFISVAEETGMISGIGQFVLKEACLQMRDWLDGFPALPKLAVCVNISPKQLTDPDFAEGVQQILEQTGVNPAHLKLEITESMIHTEDEVTHQVFSQLKRLKVQLCIDDFGTGYSCLSALHRFPIDMLKIDRSFVAAMSQKGPEMVRTIVALAHSLGLRVTAEGVETEEQVNELKQLKCELLQGFYWAKPLPAKAAKAYLARVTHS